MIVMHVGKQNVIQLLYPQKLQVLHESCRVAGHSAIDKHCCSVREYYQAGISELGACLLGYGLLLAAHEVEPDGIGLFCQLNRVLSPGNGVYPCRVLVLRIQDVVCVDRFFFTDSGINSRRRIAGSRKTACGAGNKREQK